MVDAGRTRSLPSGAVLYVDPDEAARRRTSRALAAGADDAIEIEAVTTAAALRDALADESSAYACVVTEYRLADTDADALALYDSLRADGLATAPFVLYTGDGSEALASEAITAGFSGYVPKGRADSLERLRAQLRTVGGADRGCEHERDLERYRTLVETVGDSMYVLDADGRIEMANEAMADALETTRDDLVGRPMSDFVVDEDADRVRATLEDLRTVEDRAWETTDVTVEFGDGTTCDAEANVAPLVDADGAVTGSVGVVRDVSERAERERRIRRLHDGTRRLMAATETDEIARVVTEIAADALDLDLNSVHLYEPNVLTRSAARSPGDAAADGPATAGEAEVPTDEAVADDADRGGLVPAAMSDRAVELFGGRSSHIEPGGGIAWDAYEAGEAMVHGDVRRAPNVRNPDTPIRSEAHVPLGDHGIFIASSLEPNDFDPEALALARVLAANAEAALDRAERECELADRSRELERQNERLEAFASTVSHDLRNPLTLAMGHLESLAELADGDGNGAAAEHCEEIRWALERMDELVENVLTLARSGRRLTETESVDLEAIIERAHRTVDPDLAVRIDGPLPPVEGDDARLRVLFENALRNAIEHAGTDVTVTVAPTPEGFAIADDGPGIAPDERDRVLEWGYSTDAEGTGFGLAIVAEVVEAHGWSIAVEESEAGGLRLVVSVPP